MKKHLTLLSGSANLELAEAIAKNVGVELTPIKSKKFNDGESYVHIEKSVRGSHVFVIQPTSPPVNDNLMELLIIIDALKRASAKEITAIIPYFGYARQDRKIISREPITAKLVADLLEKAGVARVVTFDLHVDQIQGFFDVPVDNLQAMPLLGQAVKDIKMDNLVVVAPDAGGTTRARRFAKLLYADLAIMDKRRPAHGEAKIMHILGEVKNKNAILIDDIIDSAGTICKASIELRKQGVKSITVCATHALLSQEAVDILTKADIDDIIVTDSIQIPKEKKMAKLKIVSLASFAAELVNSVFEGAPMGAIVQKKYYDVKNG